MAGTEEGYIVCQEDFSGFCSTAFAPSESKQAAAEESSIVNLPPLYHCKKNCCSFVDTTETVGDSVPIRQTFLSMQQHLSAHFSPAGRKESGD